MAFGEQMKNKADEVHLQDKAKDFGDAVADVIKEAVGLVAGFAQDNRPKVDEVLDKAQTTLAQTNGGKHAETVTKVRASVDKGIDKLVEHQTPATPETPRAGSPVPPMPPVPPMTPPAATAAPVPPAPVPDDRHSAFDEDPAGSPS